MDSTQPPDKSVTSGRASPRRRNERGEGPRLRNELIEAAMRILDSSPTAQLSLRMVAREAGVAAPSIYAHFANAQSMVAEVVRDCWRQLGDEMSAAAAQAQDGGALGKLRAQMSAYVRYATEQPSRYQLLFALQPIETALPRDLPGLVQPAYRNVMTSLKQLVAEGYALPGPDLLAATMLIISIAHGRIALAQTASSRPANSTAGVEMFVLDAIARFFTG